MHSEMAPVLQNPIQRTVITAHISYTNALHLYTVSQKIRALQ